MNKKNFSKIELKEEYLAEKYNSENELPQDIRLDACTICQLKCPSCLLQIDNEGVNNGCKHGYLKFKDFKKFLDENKSVKSIELSGNGEVFLNPELVKILEYAHKKVKLTFKNGVNLNYLTDEQAEALVKYQVDTVCISIDGASQETYSLYRVGGDYEKVINNLKKIIEYKKQYKRRKPYLIWKYVVFGHNEHEIDKAKKEVKKLPSVTLGFDSNFDKNYSPLKDAKTVEQKTGLISVEKYSNPVVLLNAYNEGKEDWFYCNFLWDAPQINWDGQILGCCANYKGNFGGNAFKDGLLNALNNPKMIYAKNMLMGKAPALKDIPCYDCHIYKAMKDANVWVKSPKQLKMFNS